MTRVLPPSGNGGEAPEIEDGTYPATCWQSREDVIPAGNYGDFSLEKDKPVVVLGFVLDDLKDSEDSNLIIETRGLTISSHEKAKLTQIASVLLGKNMAGQQFDTDELVAARCLVEVRHRDNGWPYVNSVMAPIKTPLKVTANG